jgi:hypothetical protein
MMRLASRFGVFFVSSAMVGTPIASGLSQGLPSSEDDMVLYGQPRDVGGVHCAGLTWHISRMVQPDNTVRLNGPIWYEDGTGTSFAQGIGQANGTFTLNVKKMSGDGPVGTITGQRMPDGSVDATAVGSRCFAETVHLAPGQTSEKAKK